MNSIPGIGKYTEYSDYNWAYNTTPGENVFLQMNDKISFYPRGKGIGGTSLIHGLIYLRAHKEDFNKWAAEGNPGWSYDEILPLLKKSEHFHGNDGHLNIEYPSPISPQTYAFLAANQELGYNLTDLNANNLGVSLKPQNTKLGKRLDGDTVFIKPISNRTNLEILTESFVTKLHIKKFTKKTKGVHFTYKNHQYFVKVRKEVILCAGIFNSAQLLMLSGIGPKEHLKNHNIPVIQDLPVGMGFANHASITMYFNTNYTNPTQSLVNEVNDYMNGYGRLTNYGNAQALGYYESSFNQNTKIPDIEVLMLAANFQDKINAEAFNLKTDDIKVDRPLMPDQALGLVLCVLHTKSRGTIKLRSNNPFDYPLIDPNLFSDQNGEDLEKLYEASQIALKLVGSDALKKIATTPIITYYPACEAFEYNSKDYWICIIRHVGNHAQHPVASCPMGPDPSQSAVVDYQLKVHKISKLRIADASVIPFPVAGHPYATCVLIGEKLAEMLKQEYMVNDLI